jgi:hypothetical protein
MDAGESKRREHSFMLFCELPYIASTTCEHILNSYNAHYFAVKVILLFKILSITLGLSITKMHKIANSPKKVKRKRRNTSSHEETVNPLR